MQHRVRVLLFSLFALTLFATCWVTLIVVQLPSGLSHRQDPFPTAPPVIRTFPVDGISKVIVRAAEVDRADISVDPRAKVIEVTGTPYGGTRGYHPPDPSWRETPPEEAGLDFVSARHGDIVVISTRGEFHYIHHHYAITKLGIRVPAKIQVIRQARKLTGSGNPDLTPP